MIASPGGLAIGASEYLEGLSVCRVQMNTR